MMLDQLSKGVGPIVPVALRAHRTKSGMGICFIQEDRSERQYSFAQLGDCVAERSRQLLASGLEKGDRIGMILPNSYEFVVTFLACLETGIVAVPMFPPMSFGKLDGYLVTAARILKASGAKALVTEKRVESILWSLVSQCSELADILCVETLDATDGVAPNLEHIQLDDVAFLQFTSGSTSVPKGVQVTHRSLIANLHGIMKYGLEIGPDDIAVSWLPMFHDMGLIGFVLAPVWCGVPTVHIPTTVFVKHPSIWMETLSRYGGTLSFAPNFAFALAARRTSDAKLKKLDLSKVKALGCGAEPIHAKTLEAFARRFEVAGLQPEVMLPVYGMAEATLAMTFSELGKGMQIDRVEGQAYHAQGYAKPAASDDTQTIEFVSCGRPFPEHDVAIVGDNDERLDDRLVGEVVFRGPSVATGYYQQVEATRQAFCDVGLKTGDLGYMVDGNVYITGRKKDLIILNGRNYDPQTVEWAVAEVDGVRKGNVVAFSRQGTATEELVVVVESRLDELEPLMDPIKKSIQEATSLTVADVRILRPGQLPKTSSGKLQRSMTRELYLNGQLGREVRTIGSRGQPLILARHFSRSLVAKLRHKVKKGTVSALGAVRNMVPF
jgi:fatty-acyl-CoA synthase